MDQIKSIARRIPQYSLKAALPFVKVPEPPVLKGSGMVLRFPEVIGVTGIKKALIVCGPTVEKLGLMDGFLGALDNQDIEYVIFSDAMPNPTINNVYDALEMYLENDCDSVIAFGGGSSIDCAKITAAKVTNDIPIEKMAGLFKLKHRLPPFFAIPTTSGSGSEATIAAVVTDPDQRLKMKIIDNRLCPLSVCLDPELTAELPARTTAETGMDALTHAIEAYLGFYDTPYVREKALDSSAIIFNTLEAVYEDGSNLALRERMMEAAFKAGEAFTRGMVGYVHAFSHAIGALYDLPHGRTNAILLPHVLDFYKDKPQIASKLAELAYNADLGAASLDDIELTDCLIEKIHSMNTKMGIPSVIKEVDLDDIPSIVERVQEEASGYPVPIILDYNDCIEILSRVLTD